MKKYYIHINVPGRHSHTIDVRGKGTNIYKEKLFKSLFLTYILFLRKYPVDIIIIYNLKVISI